MHCVSLYKLADHTMDPNSHHQAIARRWLPPVSPNGIVRVSLARMARHIDIFKWREQSMIAKA